MKKLVLVIVIEKIVKIVYLQIFVINYHLYLVDSKDMLDNLPDEKFITKFPCEFPKYEAILELKNSMDCIIIYSVLHHVVEYGNYIKFLDTAVELLKANGRLLLADISNITKKKRFYHHMKKSNSIKNGLKVEMYHK